MLLVVTGGVAGVACVATGGAAAGFSGAGGAVGAAATAACTDEPGAALPDWLFPEGFPPLGEGCAGELAETIAVGVALDGGGESCTFADAERAGGGDDATTPESAFEPAATFGGRGASILSTRGTPTTSASVTEAPKAAKRVPSECWGDGSSTAGAPSSRTTGAPATLVFAERVAFRAEGSSTTT